MGELHVLKSIHQVSREAWDALVGADNPFVEHGFLAALEDSGSVGPPDTGWVPQHLALYEGATLVAAAPCYLKFHSYGEYIFDWGWASAAQRAGLPYYPKLLVAVPFTPATGPRLLVHPQGDALALRAELARGLAALTRSSGASSAHVLFAEQPELAALVQVGFAPRESYQFHWLREPSWRTFDDYLAAMRSQARKQVRRERRIAREQGLRIVIETGEHMPPNRFAALRAFYENTVWRKGAAPYLTEAFFAALSRPPLRQRVLCAFALREDEPVAGALFFCKGAHLYGRYYGVHEPLECVHFELCYYAPIEWALAHGITRFEAGAQGEHKLKRGLLPSVCHSAHHIVHPGLARAVREYLPREAMAVREDMEVLEDHGPFRVKGPPQGA